MRKDLLVVGLLVAILALMVVPLSDWVIDILLTVNIALSVLLLMVAVYLKHPSDFATFPAVILLGTAFRLSLSVATTRLILTEADAGQIIDTFGQIVVSGSVAVGLVIFLIITVVQFLVVTKGAERVAEVGARFALDALPGKQMSIDADIRAGTIEAEEGAVLRKRLDKDSRFFGAMDGAMKFVKGDAIAGIIIIIINLIGGIAVGVSLHGYTFGESTAVFSLLTVGDGLVAQIPALLMSLCAGVIVTRVANAENADLGTDIAEELVADVRVPAVASMVVMAIGFIPGFPTLVFAGASSVLILVSLALRNKLRLKERAEAEAEEQAGDAPDTDETPAITDERSQIEFSDRLRILIGADLAEQVDMASIQSQICAFLDQHAKVSGVRFDGIPVLTSQRCERRELQIELDDVPITRDHIPDGMAIVIGDGILPKGMGAPEEAHAEINWPDMRGFWVRPEDVPLCEDMEFHTIPLEDAFAMYLFRIFEQNVGALFSQVEFNRFLEEAKEKDANAIAQIEEALPTTVLFQVLRYLLEDGIPLKPLRLLVESIGYWLQTTPGIGAIPLSECLRSSLKRQLCHRIAGPDSTIGAAMLDPEVETALRVSVNEAQKSGQLSGIEGLILPSDFSEGFLNQFRTLVRRETRDSRKLAVIAPADIRRRLRNYLAANDVHLPVLAPHEISNEVSTFPIVLITPPDVGQSRRRKARAKTVTSLAGGPKAAAS